MKSFLKFTFASMVGTILTFVLIFFISMGIVGAMISSLEDEKVEVKENSILKISLDNAIHEREPINPFSDFKIKGISNEFIGLDKMLASIENAKTDEKIKAIYLDCNTFMPIGMATLSEIRNKLEDFKKSGKKIIAYSEFYTQKSYYLASIADEVYLNPTGSIEFSGIYAQVMFFKNAMDKLEIDMQIIRGPGNEFKSAVEPFMLDKMSEANKEQTSVFISSIWNKVLSDISKSRNVDVAKLQDVANKLSAFDATQAKENGLVTDLIFYDQLLDKFKTITSAKSYDKISMVKLEDYKDQIVPQNRKARNSIAVIYAEGEIQTGEGDDETIGSDRLAAAIREARLDSNIKAIVLRVNSPGGSALASEVMYRELVLAKKVKPIVVSMGDYAASGGYYISCMADQIIAQPNTLTGSIGVFGMIPNFKGLLNNKLGITFDGVKTAENADLASVSKSLSPYQTEVIRNQVDIIYKTFIGHVAEGRKMTVAQVDSIGQGRVWSGVDALKIGLVDKLGNIDDAIIAAAKLAKVEDYKIKSLPKQKNPLDDIFGKSSESVDVEAVIVSKLGALGSFYNYVSKVKKSDMIQARMPFVIDIN